jgi:glutathione S-transferase
MIVTLYVFADSHPCEAVLAAAEAKGLEVRRRELPPVVHRVVMGTHFGAGRTTVPGMVVGRERIHGTTAIFHRLDALVPAEPVLYPADPQRRAAVVAAETWGAGGFQDIGRRLVWSHLVRSHAALIQWADATPHVPSRAMKRRFARPLARLAVWANRATDDAVRTDLAALPALLDRVDGLIADGTIGGAEPNAADFQILSSIGVWMALADLRPAIIDRPCGRASAARFPHYVSKDGLAAGVLPAAWFAPLRAAG